MPTTEFPPADAASTSAPADPAPAPQRALDALRRLVDALRAGAHAPAGGHGGGSGVSGAQLFVLRALAHAPGLTLGALAARTHTGQSTASEVVARLVARGLVARRPDPADGRRRVLRLTPAGRAVARGAPPTVQEQLVAALDALPAECQRVIAEGLEAWVDAAGLAGRPAVMFFEPAEAGADAAGAAAAGRAGGAARAR